MTAYGVTGLFLSFGGSVGEEVGSAGSVGGAAQK